MGILIGFLVIISVVFVVMARVWKVQEVEQENRMMKSYMDSMQELYAVMQNKVEAARRYRHDLARHIQTLERMLEQGETESCMNEVLLAVLDAKKKRCADQGILLNIQVEPAGYEEIEQVDLSGLLHNLLDNAIEANERIPEGSPRGISFQMGKKGTQIWIHMENRISPGEEISFVTSKENKDEHGIGTKIIDSLVQRYSGQKEIRVDAEQGILVEDIYLNGKTAESGEEERRAD